MARKPIERRLPPLEEIFPNFNGFPKGGHRLHLATEYMQSAARHLRKARNQSFYSMREAAQFLPVPLRTMALAYQQLENEGLIVRVRGSRTVLLGKAVHSQHPARSIVSVPLHSESIISSHFTRTLCRSLSQELWRHHFVSNLIFSTVSEYPKAPFAGRLMKQSDVVIWVFPIRDVKENILTLRDHGVQNVLLCSIEDLFLPANYLMDWTSAYKKLLHDWKISGIRHVVVSKPVRLNFEKIVDSFLQQLRHEGFEFTLAEANPLALRNQVEAARKKKISVGCAIIEHETSHQLCNEQPAVMIKLTTRCRVLFGRGRVHVPYFFGREVRADVIGFSGEEVAAQVAGDLGRRAEKIEPIRLLPRWSRLANLGELFT